MSENSIYYDENIDSAPAQSQANEGAITSSIAAKDAAEILNHKRHNQRNAFLPLRYRESVPTIQTRNCKKHTAVSFVNRSSYLRKKTKYLNSDAESLVQDCCPDRKSYLQGQPDTRTAGDAVRNQHWSGNRPEPQSIRARLIRRHRSLRKVINFFSAVVRAISRNVHLTSVRHLQSCKAFTLSSVLCFFQCRLHSSIAN